MSDDEMKVSPLNLDDAAKGKTDTILVTHGKKGGRGLKGEDMASVLQQAGVKKDWKGTLVVAFPDVCKTPAAPSGVPIPYPNIGAQSGGGSDKIKVALRQGGYSGVKVHTMGDEGRTMKGMLGAKAHTKAHFSAFSFDAKAEGKGLIAHELTHVVQQGHTPHTVPKGRK